MSGGITLLPFRRGARPPSLPPAASTPSPASLAARNAARRVRLGAARVASFFRRREAQRAAERALAIAGGSRPIARLVSTALAAARKRFRGLRAPWKAGAAPAWKRRLETAFTVFTRAASVRGILGLAKAAYRKLVGPTKAEKRELEVIAARERQKSAQQLVRLCIALSGILALRHKARRRRLIKEKAQALAETWLHDGLVKAEGSIARTRRSNCASTIQRCWRRVRVTNRDSKQRVLNLIMLMTVRLEHQATVEQHCEAVRQDLSSSTALSAIHGATTRLAARLVQRVWRGYRARKRVFLLCEWRRKKAMRERIRARARIAKEALLTPSQEEIERRNLLKARAAARKQKTPLILPDGYQQAQRDAVLAATELRERSNKLAPIEFVSAPPRVSTLTRAKTQRMPFSKFERIRERQARINMDNVWVAIPVAHDPVSENAAGKLASRRRRSKFVETRYDWVPAALLGEGTFAKVNEGKETANGS